MVPDWLFLLPLNLITDVADRHNIERELLAAVVQTESSGQTCATRFEPGFRYTHRPADYFHVLQITYETEIEHQKTSWGLMQIMGATAREMGFKDYMPRLCIPRTGLEFGARYLKSRIVLEGADEPARIYAAYNAGSVRMTDGGMFVNQRAVDRFMQYYRELKAVE